MAGSPFGLELVSQSPAKNAFDQHQMVTIKIRDGKTGFPTWLASPYVFLGQTDPQRFTDSYRRTKLWGDAHVDVKGITPREMKVWVDFIHRDCRFAESDTKYRVFDFGGNTLRGLETYDMDVVLTKGLVAQNLCSSKTQKPEPGVLTIYVISPTFQELWDT
jgi:hypothetical protein